MSASLGTCFPCEIQNRMLAAGVSFTAGPGDFDNALAWLQDQDITGDVLGSPIAWQSWLQATFANATETTPSGDPFTGSCPECNPSNTTDYMTGDPYVPTAFGEPVASFSQFVLPLPCTYFIIAAGTHREPTDIGVWFAQACQSTLTSTPITLDIPIPDQDVDDSVLVNEYILGIIVPSAGAGLSSHTTAITSSLATLTPSNCGILGFGDNWAGSIGNPCGGSDGGGSDPFTGADSWP